MTSGDRASALDFDLAVVWGYSVEIEPEVDGSWFVASSEKETLVAIEEAQESFQVQLAY